MIRDGNVTYPGVDSLLAWHPASPTVNAFLGLTLTTILSYQATALFFDILLGRKVRGEARVTDIGTMLLAEESSLLYVCANLFGSYNLSRWKMHGINSPCPKEKITKKRITVPVLVKFLVLVIVAPLVNLVTVIVVLESDREITFKQARFGGIALGMTLNPGSQLIKGTGLKKSTCILHGARYRRFETPTAEFFTCFHIQQSVHRNLSAGSGLLRLSRNPEVGLRPSQTVYLEFQVGKMFTIIQIIADVHVEGKRTTFRVLPNLSMGEGKELFQIGTLRLLEQCGCEKKGPLREEILQTHSEGDTAWNITQVLSCRNCGDVKVSDVLSAVVRPITLVDSEKFVVMKLFSQESRAPENAIFMNGEDFTLLRRRSSFMSIATLWIVTTTVVFLRLLIRRFVHNGTHLAVEIIMKDWLGIPRFDSMLQDDSKIRYNERVEVVGRDEEELMMQYMSSASVLADSPSE